MSSFPKKTRTSRYFYLVLFGVRRKSKANELREEEKLVRAGELKRVKLGVNAALMACTSAECPLDFILRGRDLKIVPARSRVYEIFTCLPNVPTDRRRPDLFFSRNLPRVPVVRSPRCSDGAVLLLFLLGPSSAG